MGEAPRDEDRSGGRLDYEAARRLLRTLEESGTEAGLGAIGGYRLLEPLGSGASGEVFLAQRPGSDQPVVLKVVHVEGGVGRSTQVLREVRAQADRRLECVARLLDSGAEGGRLYVVHEYVDGETLEAWMKRPGVDDRARAGVLARLAAAVQQLHERGVLHRDLKPTNAMVRPDGSVVLIDLGLAHVQGSEAGEELTVAGVPMGTPAFMSPEQARGDHHRVSTRSDVFALGAIACRVLTGSAVRPGSESVADGLRRAAEGEVREPLELRRDLPRPLAAIIRKACAARPEERYASAADFAADLDRWVNGEPVAATPGGPVTRAMRWAARHPRRASVALTCLVCASIVGGSLLAVWALNLRPDHVEWSADRRTAKLVSVSGRVFHSMVSPDGPLGVMELVERPASMGGGSVVVCFGKGDSSRRGEAPSVEIREAAPGARLTWSALRDSPVGIPEGFASDEIVRNASFHVDSVLLADVFAEPPGEPATPEIVCVIREVSKYPCAVRVYDLAGRLRFEAWHPGWIESMYWIGPSGVSGGLGTLVCTGVCNRLTMDDVNPEGVGKEIERSLGPNAAVGVWPRFVLGLTPRDGEVGQVIEPVMPEGVRARGDRGDASTTLRWYKWLQPWNMAAASTRVTLTPPKESELRGNRVWVLVVTDVPERDMHLVLDAAGVVHKSQMSDGWRGLGMKKGELEKASGRRGPLPELRLQ